MTTRAVFCCVFLFFLSLASRLRSQDLMDLLDEDDNSVNYTIATFKGTHIVNGHSSKVRSKGELEVLISHRFGPVSGGAYELFGLDQANTRIALEYGVSDVLELGLGRSTYEKTFDGFVKWKILRQKTGAENSPISLVWFSSIAVTSLKFDEQDVSFADRTGYTNELIIARKFSRAFSFQLVPGLVHINTVPTDEDPNDLPYLGAALRYKITSSVHLTMEYYYRFDEYSSDKTFDPFGIGFDIETGGHVFQLHFTNSRTVFEKGFIAQTFDDFWKGDIRFGFNISRTFQTGVNKRN